MDSDVACRDDTVKKKPTYANANILTGVKTNKTSSGVMACIVVTDASKQDSAIRTLKSVARDIEGCEKQIKTTVSDVITRLRQCPATVTRSELEVVCTQLEAVPALCDYHAKLCAALTAAINSLNDENDGLKADLTVARERIEKLEARLAILENKLKEDRQAVVLRDIVYRINDYLYWYCDEFATIKTLDQYVALNASWAVELQDLINQEFARLDSSSGNSLAPRPPAVMRCQVTAERMTGEAFPVAHVTEDECATLRTDDIRALLGPNETVLLNVLLNLVNKHSGKLTFKYVDPTTRTPTRKKYIDYPLRKLAN